jgi:DNA-binding Xre family transcriptional regulator
MAFDIIFINKIDECIVKHRKKTGATKTFIAQKMGFNNIQNLDSLIKSTNPTITNLIKLSIVLDCSLLDLFEYKIVEKS